MKPGVWQCFQPWGLWVSSDTASWRWNTECGKWVFLGNRFIFRADHQKESTTLSIGLMEALMTSSISLIYAFITVPLDDCSVSLDMSASYLTLHPEKTVKGLILWWTPCLPPPHPPPPSTHPFTPSLLPSLPSAQLPATAKGPRRNSVFVVLPFFGVEEQEEFNPHCPGDCRGWGGVLRL